MRATVPLHLLLGAFAAPLTAQSVVYTPPPPDSAAGPRDTAATAPDTGAVVGDSPAARPDAALTPPDSAAPEDTSLTARMDVRRGGGWWGPARMTLIEAARVGGLRLSTFARLVDAAGWTRRLAEGGPYTAFAPSDAAFAAMPSAELEATLRSPDRAERLLRAHLAPSRVLLAQATRDVSIPRLQGAPIRVTVSGNTLVLDDDIPVVRPDVAVTNGVIQIIGSVMRP